MQRIIQKSTNQTFFCLLILFVLNLVIFWEHYFNGVGFPWDFDKGYYAIPAFWTTLVSQGIFPQWIPFQSMGYPFFLNAQTALFYPFLWLFPILNIQYTLHAAVVFQILHVFFGSVGMFFFLKYLFKSPKYAIVGAIAFQFFGGFFANSEHQDIIRAFALAPWMFYVFTLNLEKPTICRRILFIPIVIYLLATGAYPGNFISSIFMMGLFIVLQTVNGLIRGIGKRRSLLIGSSLAGLMILGVGVSTIHLGPFVEYGNELTRFDDTDSIKQHGLTEQQFAGFFMSNKTLLGEKSMTSTFLTLPILILASFFPLSSIKKYWFFFVILAVAVLMAAGKQTIFWEVITSILPILESTRFPFNDYRIFIAIPIMIFAIEGLKAIIERNFTLKTFILRITFVVSWFLYGLFLLQSKIAKDVTDYNSINQQIILAMSILVFTIFTLLSYYFIKSGRYNISSIKKSIGVTLIILLFVSLIIADGFRVITDMITWKRIPLDERYLRFDVPLTKDSKLISHSIVENLPDLRPEREITAKNMFSWKGYLSGNYMMQDVGNAVLKSRSIVESNDIYKETMFMKWTPLLMETSAEQSKLTKIFLPESTFSNLKNISRDSSIVQTHYGINDITYKVSLDEPKLMVENEMYFPGWKATLIYPDREIELQALVVNDVFRAWLLPAGDYEMKAHFEFPNFVTYQIISLSAFVVWLGIIVAFWLRSRNKLMA